jgi:hypothetical protein
MKICWVRVTPRRRGEGVWACSMSSLDPGRRAGHVRRFYLILLGNLRQGKCRGLPRGRLSRGERVDQCVVKVPGDNVIGSATAARAGSAAAAGRTQFRP